MIVLTKPFHSIGVKLPSRTTTDARQHLNNRNSEPATMSLVAHDIIEIESDSDSDYSDDEEDGANHRLLRYLSTRAADLAAAGITEGELELDFQRVGGQQDRYHQVLQDRRGRNVVDGGEGGRGRPPLPPLPPPLPPPPQPRLAPRAPLPQTPPRPIQKFRLPKLKSTPKSTPKPKTKSKPKRDPDDMMVDATCVICYSATTNTVLIPCGHLVLCSVCIGDYVGDIS